MTTKAARKVYDSDRWRKLRKLVLERDGYICHQCGGHADTVDHDPDIVTLLALGLDPYDMQHLRSMCRVCHGRKDGRRSPTAGRRKEKPKRRNPYDNWVD